MARSTEGDEKVKVGIETGIHWRCMKCDHRGRDA